MRQGIDARQAAIPNEGSAIAHLNSKKENNTIYLLLLIIAGAILAVFIVGIVLLISAYFVYRQRQKINAQILQANSRIGTLYAEINNLNYTLNQRIDQVTQEIQGELSAAYIMKPRDLEQSQVFESRTVQTMTAPPPGQPLVAPPTQVSSPTNYVRQTTPDTRMIKCAYCERDFPQAYVKCPHCGAARGS